MPKALQSAVGAVHEQSECQPDRAQPSGNDRARFGGRGDFDLRIVRGHSQMAAPYRAGIRSAHGPRLQQNCLAGLVFAVLLAGCANSDYRFERVDGDQAISIPMKFDSLYGARDGEIVTAEARFSNGDDSAQMNIRLYLAPPAEFVSGTYRITTGGKTVEGMVECLSLDYQGGQAAVPSVGGRFVLKPGYRVTFPSTPIKRR